MLSESSCLRDPTEKYESDNKWIWPGECNVNICEKKMIKKM